MLNEKQIRQTLELYAQDQLPAALLLKIQRDGSLGLFFKRLTNDVCEASQEAQRQSAINPDFERLNPMQRASEIEALVRVAEEVAMEQVIEEIDSLLIANETAEDEAKAEEEDAWEFGRQFYGIRREDYESE
ncbi:MAG: hypothetical protein ACRC01_00540 [Deefgea sp.]